MAKPLRVNGPGTFFVTSGTHQRIRIFQQPKAAELFLEVLQHYRREEKYKLHAFVAMPDHIHLLITPIDITLERALQLIKGGFSHRLGVNYPVWQRGFTDRRMRDRDDFLHHRDYIHDNPVRARLCARPEDYSYSSAYIAQPTSAAKADPSDDQQRHG